MTDLKTVVQTAAEFSSSEDEALAFKRRNLSAKNLCCSIWLFCKSTPQNRIKKLATLNPNKK